MSRIKLILLFAVFVITTSCNVHTFTFGEGPTDNYSICEVLEFLINDGVVELIIDEGRIKN